MESIKIEGKTPSINQQYTGRRFLTQAGKDFKEYATILIKNQWKKKPLKGKVEVAIDFYFEKGRHDIDGCIKTTLDCMNGIVYLDDSQIVTLIVTKNVGKNRTEIRILETREEV